MPIPSPYEFRTPYVCQPRGAESTDYELRVGDLSYLDYLATQEFISRSALEHLDVRGVV